MKKSIWIVLFFMFLMFIAGCQNKEANSESRIQYLSKKDGNEVSGWEKAVIKKLEKKYHISKKSKITFDYSKIEKSEMDDETYTVKVEKKNYKVTVPGPEGFLFHKDGSIVKENDKMTMDDKMSNIELAK